MVADEWYSPLLKYVGIGKKDYLRAGHAALVLINLQSGILEYHDFGRYITPEPYGRVRGKDTDHELDFPLKAEIENGHIANLDVLLEYFSTHPEFTHGDGVMLASVCHQVDYDKARAHITMMQNKGFIKYAAFESNSCNCARFVTDALIASVTDLVIVKKLKRSKWFTPSTIGNVLIAAGAGKVYQVSSDGAIGIFSSTKFKENKRYFLDRLQSHQPNLVGTLRPKPTSVHQEHAQWLSGIAAGAWFELHDLGQGQPYRYRRISPYGNIDVDGLYKISKKGFDANKAFEIVQYSNCKFFHVKQDGDVYRFDFVEQFTDALN